MCFLLQINLCTTQAITLSILQYSSQQSPLALFKYLPTPHLPHWQRPPYPFQGTKKVLHCRFVSSNIHPLAVRIGTFDKGYDIIVHQEVVDGTNVIRMDIAEHEGDLSAELHFNNKTDVRTTIKKLAHTNRISPQWRCSQKH